MKFFTKNNPRALLILVTILTACGQQDDAIETPTVPQITDFSPKTGLAGDTVTVTGDHFEANSANISVLLGDTEVSISEVTEATIKFVIPENSTSNMVRVTVGDIASDFIEPLEILNLYLAGYESDGTYEPKYWTNGIGTSLGIDGDYEGVSAMDVYQGSVYLAGQSSTLNSTSVAKYWVDGVSHDLTDGTTLAQTFGIRVVDGDIYVCGYEKKGQANHVGTLWKNGEVVFTTNGQKIAYFSSIDIFENSVYLAGLEGNTATYWKDGQPVKIGGGTENSRLKGIKVTGDGVYVAGYESKVAKYWKNGVEHPLTGLTSSAQQSDGFSIDVENGHVYVCGYEKNVNGNLTAVLWVDGAPVNLTPAVGRAEAYSVRALNGNVYCAGYELDQGHGPRGKYWRNAQPHIVTGTDKSGELTAVFIGR
jgi:hypothetical protein